MEVKNDYQKTLAVLSAVTLICSCTGFGRMNYTFCSTAAEQMTEKSETFGVKVSFPSAKSTLPDGMIANIVKSENGVDTIVDSWEIKNSDLIEINNLESFENISYRIDIENIPKDYYLPQSIDIITKNNGEYDKLRITGYYSSYDYYDVFKNTAYIPNMYLSYGKGDITLANMGGPRERVTVISNDDGFRYYSYRIEMNLPFSLNESVQYPPIPSFSYVKIFF